MRIQQRLTRLEARRHALHLLRLRAMDDNMWRGLGADDELCKLVTHALHVLTFQLAQVALRAPRDLDAIGRLRQTRSRHAWRLRPGARGTA